MPQPLIVVMEILHVLRGAQLPTNFLGSQTLVGQLVLLNGGSMMGNNWINHLIPFSGWSVESKRAWDSL